MSFLSAILGFLTPLAHAAGAQTVGDGNAGVKGMWALICSALPCSVASDPISTTNFFGAKAVRFLFPLVSIVAVIMVIYAGIKIVTSDGSDEKVGEAKKIIMVALAGVVLSVLATTILTFVMSYLGEMLQ